MEQDNRAWLAALLLAAALGALALVAAPLQRHAAWTAMGVLALGGIFVGRAAPRVPLALVLVAASVIAILPGLFAGRVDSLAVLPWAGLALVCMVLGAAVRQANDGRRYWWGFVAGIALLQGGLAWYQKISQIPLLAGMIVESGPVRDLIQVGRPSGAMVTANVLGGWLAMVLPGLSEQIIRVGRGPYRMWLMAAWISALVGLILSRSVGAWAALSVALLLWAWISRRRGPVVWAALVAIALGGLLTLRFSGADWGHTLLQGRQLLWAPAWELMQDNLLFGVGLSGYVESLRDLALTKQLKFGGTDPHNLFLSAGLSLGLLGLLSVASLAALAFVRLISVLRREPWGGGLVGPALGCLVFLLHAQVSLVYTRPEVTLLFFAMLGLCLSRPLVSLVGRNSIPSPAWPVSRAARAGLAACLAASVAAPQIIFAWVVGAATMGVMLLAAFQRARLQINGPWAAVSLLLAAGAVTWQSSFDPSLSANALLFGACLWVLAVLAGPSRSKEGHWMDRGLLMAALLSLLIWALMAILGRLVAVPSLLQWHVLQMPLAALRALCAAVMVPLALAGIARFSTGERGWWRVACGLAAGSLLVLPGLDWQWPAAVAGLLWIGWMRSGSLRRPAWDGVVALGLWGGTWWYTAERTQSAWAEFTWWGRGWGSYEGWSKTVEAAPAQGSWYRGAGLAQLPESGLQQLWVEIGPAGLVLLVLALGLWLLERRRRAPSAPVAVAEEAIVVSVVAMALIRPGGVSLSLVVALIFWMALFRRPGRTAGSVASVSRWSLAGAMAAASLVFNFGTAQALEADLPSKAEQRVLLAPWNSAYHSDSADLFERQAGHTGRFIDARRALQRRLSCLHQGGATVEGYREYSEFLWRISRWIPEEGLRRLAVLEPDWERVRYGRTDEPVKLSWMRLAELQVLRGLDCNLRDPHLWRDLAWYRVHMQDYAGAAVASGRALDLEPAFVSAREIRALSYRKLGMEALAQEDLKWISTWKASAPNPETPWQEALSNSWTVLNR